MTNTEVVTRGRYTPKLDPRILAIIRAEGDMKLAASWLGIDLDELYDYRNDNAKEIAHAMHDVYVLETIERMRDELLDADFNGTQRAYVNIKGTPLIVAPNMRNPGDEPNTFDNPLEELKAEIERMQSIDTLPNNGNGHG